MTLVSYQPLEKGGYISGNIGGGVISKRNRHVLHILIYLIFHTVGDQTQSPVHAGLGCSTTELYILPNSTYRFLCKYYHGVYIVLGCLRGKFPT